MDKRLLLIWIIGLTLFISACSSPNYDVIDNTVIMDDENVYLEVGPATLSGSGWVETEFVSKQYSGNIDFVFGFNVTDAIPTQAQIYHPRNITEVLNFTCPTTDFTYTLNPNTLYCWNPTNMSTLFNGSFNSGNLATRTVSYNHTYQSDWRTWNPDGSIDRNYEGMTRWYYATNEPVVEDTTYRLRFYLSVPNGSSGKYALALKPSSETIEQAITNGHFYMLDPWWDTGSDYTADEFRTDYWSFDDNLINTISGRNFTGGDQSYSTGILNNAVYTETDKLTISNAIGNGIPVKGDETTPWSVNFYFKVTGDSYGEAYNFIDTRTSVGSNELRPLLRWNNAGNVIQYLMITDAGTNEIDSGALSDNVWYMTTLTYDGANNMKLYVNGTLVSSGAYNKGDVNVNTGVFSMGYGDNPDGNKAGVYVDELTIYNKSLSPVEISNIYSPTNLTDGLINLYRFNNNFNDEIGLSYQPLYSSFEYSNLTFYDGGNILYNNWESQSNSYDCVAFGSTGWTSRACGNTGPKEVCEYNETGVFEIITEEVSQTQATINCELYKGYGWHLATINSAQEQTDATSAAGAYGYWIDAHRVATNKWVWSVANFTAINSPTGAFNATTNDSSQYSFEPQGESRFGNTANNILRNDGSKSFTINSWIYWVGGTWTNWYLFDRAECIEGTNFLTGLSLSGEGAGTSAPIAYYVAKGATANSINSGDEIGKNQWYMITANYNGVTKKFSLYVNGVKKSTGTFTESGVSENKCSLGLGSTGAGSSSGVLVDNIGMWNRSLSSYDIFTLYSETYPSDVSLSGAMYPDNVGILSQIICNGTVTNGDLSNVNVTLTSYLNGVVNGTESFNNQVSPYTFTSSNTLFPLNYTVGDTWNCVIDASAYNGVSASKNLNLSKTINNSFPSFTHGNVNITMNYLNSNLIQFNCTDLEIASPNYSITNLTSDFVTPLTINQSTGIVNISGLGLADVGVHNYNITCNDSATLASVLLNATITNQAPSVPSILTPTSPYYTASGQVVLTCSGSVDPEADSIYYEFWNTTGTPSLLQNTTGTTYTYDISLGYNAWNCRAHDTNAWSGYTANRTVYKSAFGYCNSSLTKPFINFSFKDENNLSYINASSSFDLDWSIGDASGTVNGNNISESASYAFCFEPQNESVSLTASLTYQSTGYQTRLFGKEYTLTNTTTQQILYLLSTLDGTYSNYHVTNAVGSPISGVDVTVSRIIDGTLTTVITGLTDSSGSVTFWLDPDISHQFVFTKTGYNVLTQSITPSATDYYINLDSTGGSAISYNSSFEGLIWKIWPVSGATLQKGGTYNFRFNVTANLSNLYGCKMELTTNGSTLSSVEGCNSSRTFGEINLTHTLNETLLFGAYYVKLNNASAGWTLLENDARWRTLAVNSSGNTLKDFLSNAKGMAYFSTDELENTASMMMWFFLIVTILMGLLSFAEFDAPGVTTIILFVLVLLASDAGWFTIEWTSLSWSFWNQWWLTILTGMIWLGSWLHIQANRRFS